MSLVVDVALEGQRTPLAAEGIRAIALGVLRAERVRHALVSITLLSPRAIAAINRQHLGHAGPTDVIAFAFAPPPPTAVRGPVIGDIYIAPDVARRNAARFRRPVREELARLVVHGVLHVLGHDHPEGEDRVHSVMWRRQERLLARLFAPATERRGGATA